MKYLQPNEFLAHAKYTPLIDVRAPAEYREGHIPGAKSIPLLSDEERAIIGTIYKKEGRQSAIEKGLEIVGPKMKDLATQALAQAHGGKEVMVYCWRGGMRSEKMAWLFEMVGLRCEVLKGGYKAYRNALLADLSNLPGLIILQGATGSGKTEILHELLSQGEQVVDLEALANHRGSSFGGLGLGEQPTTAQFQNEVYRSFLNWDLTRRIWVEGESRLIGKVYLPDPLWLSMNKARVIAIDVPKPERIQRLVNIYGSQDQEELAKAVLRIEKRIGGDKSKAVLHLLELGRLAEVADILLDYYDKTYFHSQQSNKQQAIEKVVCAGESTHTYACRLIEAANTVETTA